jgi:glutathione S-transferase
MAAIISKVAKPVLHGTPTSTYARTCLLTLIEKGVRDFGVKPHNVHTPEQEAVHTWGKVPAMTFGNVHLFETLAITQYIDGFYQGPALQPANIADRARMFQLISAYTDNGTDAWFTIIIERLVAPGRGQAPRRAQIAAKLEASRVAYAFFESMLDDKEFFAGHALSLADLYLLPPIDFMAYTPEGKEQMNAAPRISAWLQRMRERESAKIVLPMV